MIMKRVFDIVFSFFGLLILSPVFIILSFAVGFTSKGSVFYRQKRVGRYNKDFTLYKYRSMYVGADRGSLITIGGHDGRITGVGYFMRKFKLDELPQLFNVFIGDMSFVGPRPEVRYYVDMYSKEQMRVLDVRPGITDPASIAYRNENELLEKQSNPEKYYIDVIMPDKLNINLEYINSRTFLSDIKVIFQTFSAL